MEQGLGYKKRIINIIIRMMISINNIISDDDIIINDENNSYRIKVKIVHLVVNVTSFN